MAPTAPVIRRIPAASADGTILVHDSRIGADVVRTVIGDRTGRVRELRIAPGGDFTNVVRVHLDKGRRARVPHDLDGDGIAEVDRWEH